jgi:hypothetical protein
LTIVPAIHPRGAGINSWAAFCFFIQKEVIAEDTVSDISILYKIDFASIEGRKPIDLASNTSVGFPSRRKI